MKIVTVATSRDRYYDSLVDSVAKNGGELVTLGLGDKWRGFSQKYELFGEYLETADDNEIIMFVDGYDVIILRSVEDIEKIFRSKNARILVSTERPSGIIMDAVSDELFGRHRGHFINSGTYIGFARDIRNYINTLKTKYKVKNSDDDQRLMTRFCHANPSSIDVDARQEIFMVCNRYRRDRSLIKFRNGQVENGYNETKPCVLHGPGNFDMDKVVEKYGYKLTCPFREENFNFGERVPYYGKKLRFQIGAAACAAIAAIIFLIMVVKAALKVVYSQ